MLQNSHQEDRFLLTKKCLPQFSLTSETIRILCPVRFQNQHALLRNTMGSSTENTENVTALRLGKDDRKHLMKHIRSVIASEALLAMKALCWEQQPRTLRGKPQEPGGEARGDGRPTSSRTQRRSIRTFHSRAGPRQYMFSLL